jgi:hypothetical protein
MILMQNQFIDTCHRRLDFKCFLLYLITNINVPFLPVALKQIMDINLSINPLTSELNPSAQRCLTRFLLGIFILEPCISLIYV